MKLLFLCLELKFLRGCNMEEIENTEPQEVVIEKDNKADVVKKASAPNENLVKKDPYSGKLAKTNYLLLGLLVLSVCLFIFGFGLMVIYIVRYGENITISKIKLGVILLSVGFALVVLFGVLKGVVESKRRAAYSSKHKKVNVEKFEPKEIQTESAKRDQATSETTLNITDTKEDYRFCPHCHARIPKSTGLFCPKCGKRLDEKPLND